MLTVKRCRAWVSLIGLAGLTCTSLLAPYGCRRQDKWEGHTFVVEYAWDSEMQVLRIKDTASGRQVNDPTLKARIVKEGNSELPAWIRASKLKRAKGTFHIHFLSEGAANILETRDGFDDAGSELIKDPDTTALMLAAHEGRLDRVRELIGSGENVNAKDQTGGTALMNVVSSQQIEVLRFLLDHGADVNARDLDGETALTLSAFSGQAAMVNELLHRGAIFDCNNANDRATLETAKRRRYLSVVSALKKKGLNCGLSR